MYTSSSCDLLDGIPLYAPHGGPSNFSVLSTLVNSCDSRMLCEPDMLPSLFFPYAVRTTPHIEPQCLAPQGGPLCANQVFTGSNPKRHSSCFS